MSKSQEMIKIDTAYSTVDDWLKIDLETMEAQAIREVMKRESLIMPSRVVRYSAPIFDEVDYLLVRVSFLRVLIYHICVFLSLYIRII